MCGIFGQAPTGKKANVPKLKLLGLDNITRGRDSCGYYYAGTIKKGTGTTKEWDDFIEKTIIEKGDAGNIFIGHTRSATPGIAGGYSEQNAHPFEYENMVLTHNGVIYNIDDLVKKFDVDVTGMNVDSQKLGKIIAERGFQVLNEYVGHAALAFVFKDDPNTLYLYHGASKEFVNGILLEERPLFFMHTKEGIYYSSREEGLNQIRESEEEKPVKLKHNHVYKITNGKFNLSEEAIYVVHREENNLSASSFRSKTTTYYSGGSQSNIPFTNKVTPSTTSSTTAGTGGVTTKKDINILNEDSPRRAKTKNTIIFYWKGRFHLKDGQNISLANGILHLDRKGVPVDPKATWTKSKTCYFYRGIMIRTESLYRKLMDVINSDDAVADILVSKDANLGFWMAEYSMYPVTTYEGESVNVAEAWRKRWFHLDNKVIIKNLNFTPLFSSRTYFIEDAKLVKVTSSDKNDRKTLFLSEETKQHSNGTCSIVPFNNKREDFKELKDVVKVAFNTVYQKPTDFFTSENKHAAGILREMIKDLFKVDYQVEVTDESLETFLGEFVSEASAAGITLMENFPTQYDLKAYIDDYFDFTTEKKS